MRVRQKRETDLSEKAARADRFRSLKLPILANADFTCAMCGQRYPLTRNGTTPRGGIQLHHVLPYKVFPELETDERNILPLCAHCHGLVHNDTFLLVTMMKEKGDELGVDVEARYKNLSRELQEQK